MPLLVTDFLQYNCDQADGDSVASHTGILASGVQQEGSSKKV